MITKLMAAIVMTGALWVAGDSVYRNIEFCPFSGGCCSSRVRETPDCGSTGSDCCSISRKSCCSQEQLVQTRCCDAPYVYCTLTGEIYEGCCCIIVDGRDFCVATGTFVDECCCIPLAD